MAFRNYILLFSLVVSTIAGPINVQDGDLKCAKTCEASLSDTGKFQYTIGNTYSYTYEGITETRLQGASEQTTTLKIDATADIEVISTCEYALKLRDVKLMENGEAASSSDEFRQKLEAKPLRFAFQDGIIENVCSMQGEDERVLNIKRGVLSTFQNSMKELGKEGLFTETDVSGVCPTTYTTVPSTFTDTYTITKSKDILACSERNGNISALHSKSYNIKSKMQNAPLLKTSHECVQTVAQHQIYETKCTEVLVFRPFSKDGSGAVTTAKQNLKFSSQKSTVTVTESPVQVRSSLLFHHIYDESINENAKSEVIALLQEICSEVNDEIKKSSPQLFGELVSKMKRLDSDKMMQVYNAVNGGRICTSLRGKQFFYDAVPMVATEASLALTAKLIAEKIVQSVEADAWLTQLAFIPRPNYEMLAAIMPLLNDPVLKTKALLGISAMVHKICDNNVNCQSNSHVADFISILNANIGSTCSSTTKEQRQLIMATLKAFGNAGQAVTSSSVIGRCITNTDVDIELRVIALQAYRRMPCSISREDAMRIYENFENDSELRIHAFLAIMTCPTNVLPKVRMVLSGEPVNQVGSFVWTYLENLKETSSPLKQQLSSILEDAKLRQDFNLDARKFSRNLEKSYFSDYLNAGAQIESNLIWSQRSYIPRSAMLNVTVDMFGNSINLVELGGRVQGLERIVEKFFGPNGYFGQKETPELMDNKRQTANYISSFDNTFKTPEDEITTSMYVKMFGDELYFSELDSTKWSDIQGFNVLDFLIKLAEPKKIDLTKNIQFIDSSLIVPTCVGLPMNLTVNGTSSVSVDVDGNVDLRNIAASPRSFDINGHIKPSAAVVVSGMMGVDAIVTKATMKMVASMHSSTQLDGTISLKDGQIFSVNLNTPQEKMEVFHVETEFFLNGEKMQMPESAMIYKKCTPAGVTKVIGMEMCVDVTLPTFHQTGLPLPPFTGPMNAQVFVEKKDTHTGYAFTAKYERSKEQVSGMTYEKKVLHLSVDTPGSQVDRKLLIEGVYNPAEMIASAQLQSPWTKLEWTTSFENTVEMKKAASSLKINGTQAYAIDAELGVDVRTVKTVYSPSLTISTPGKPDMSISGTAESGTGTTVAAVDLAIKNFSKKPITLTSSLSHTVAGYEFGFDLKSDVFSSSISSSVAVAAGSYSGNALVSYESLGRPAHRFTLAGKFVNETIGDLMQYSGNLGFIPTEYPHLQFNVDGTLKLTANHIDTNINVQLDQEKFSIGHKFTQQGSIDDLDLESSSFFRYPSKSIDFSGEMKHKHNLNMVKSSASMTYGGQTASGSIDLDNTITDKYTGVVDIRFPGQEFTIDADMEKMAEGHKISAEAKWGIDVDSKVSLSAMYKPGSIHELSGDIQFPGHPINLAVSLRPDPLDFMGKTTVIYNSNTYTLETEYKLEATKLTTKGSWTCPTRSLAYSVEMSNANGQLKSDSEFSWATGKKVTLTTEYTNRDAAGMYNRDVKVSVTTPFGTQSFNSELELNPTDLTMRMENELLVDGERNTFSGRYATGAGEMSIISPFITHPSIKFITAKFNHDATSATASLSWNPTQEISGSATWSNTKYSADIVTPFVSVGKFGGSFEHVDTTSADVEAYWNDQKSSLSVSRTGVEKVQFSLTHPQTTVSGFISQSGDIDLFTGEAEFNLNTDRYWSKLVFSGKGPYTLEVDINTPLAIKKISTNFFLEGTPMDFDTRATLIWDDSRIRSSMKFSGKEAAIMFNAPWQKVNAEYSLSGTTDSFTGNALLKWADDQQMDASMLFDMTSNIVMSFEVNTPFYDTVKGSFEQNGPITNFNNKATITWATAKTIAVTSEFNTAGTFKAGITGVPTQTFQKGDMSLEMEQTTSKTDLTAMLSWNDNKPITAKASMLTTNGYRITGSLETPLYDTMSLEISHSTTTTDFNNEVTLQWAADQKITSTVDITMRSGLEVKMNVNSPWRQMSFTASHRGSQTSEMVTSATFSWETGMEITSRMEFSQISDLKLVWSLETPWQIVKDLGFTLNQRGTTLQYFSNQMEVKYNQLTANLATTLDMSSGARLTIFSTNPWKNFNTKLVYEGAMNDFTASTELTVDQQTYSARTAFAYTDAISLSMDLNTLVYDPISVSLMLSAEKITANVKWGNNQVISGLAKITTNSISNAMDATISFATPFPGYESGEATINHTGNLSSFREIAEVTFNSYSGRLEAGFSSAGTIRGDVTLTSSWYNMSGRFEHTGALNDFENSADLTYAPGKTITASSKWSMTDDLEGEMKFTAPFKTIDAKYHHRTSLSNETTAYAELNIDSQSMFTSDFLFRNMPSNIKFEYTFTSPIKSFTTKYTHTGSRVTKCNANAEFTWDSTNTISADWSISMINGFATEVEVRTPWRNVSGEVKHTGTTMDSFENTLSITYDEGKTVEMETTFRMSPDFVVESKFTSPLKNANILYRHSGSIENFECHLEGAYDAMPLNADLKWSMLSGYEASLDLTSPWKNIKTSFKTNTDASDLLTTASYECDLVKMDSTLTFSNATGYTGSFVTNNPWRNMSANFDVKGQLSDFSSEAAFSWEAGQSIKAEFTTQLTGQKRELSLNINTPWRTLSGFYSRDGIWSKFDSTTSFSWATGQEIKMMTTFDMDGMDGSVNINTPWRNMFVTVKQSGDLNKFDGDYEVSWETSQKIFTTLSFNQANGMESRIRIETPWRTISSNYDFAGNYTAFTSSFDFSWATGQKIELTSSFDVLSDVFGSVSLKSPFYPEMSLKFKHTPTYNEVSLDTPFADKLELTHQYTDLFNFNTNLVYGSSKYTGKAVTSWTNGLQTLLEVSSPAGANSIELDHQGDLFTFTSTMEATWYGNAIKISTNADVPNWTLSQDLETPITGFETLSWSASCTLANSTVAAKLMATKNTDKLEFELNGDAEQQVDKVIYTYSVKVITPFTGFEENSLSETLELSPSRVSYRSTHYIGSLSNARSLEFYMMKTGSPTRASLETFVKSTINSEMSEISFNYLLEGGELSTDFKSDLKAYPQMNCAFKLSVVHSQTATDMSQQATLDITTPTVSQKIMWNVGSNGNMCESGFSLTHNAEELIHYTHKTTWSTAYQKMDNDMTLKMPKTSMFADCQFEFKYDLTQATKTAGFTLYNDPSKPFDFKSELVLGASAKFELTTPFDECKLVKSSITVNQAQQPWTVEMEGTFNEHTISASGTMSFEAPAIFNINMSFKSQIPMLEDLSLALTNSKLQDQWKPHMVLQYAADKTIEASGIFSWVNQYKASVDITTPFVSLRSMVADITIDSQFPAKMASSFEFQTSQMSEKMSSILNYDMAAKTFSYTLRSPFASVKSFEFTSSAAPRPTATMKLNGETLFTLSGNFQMASILKHTMDVTVTYPFFNKFIRVQIDNDFNSTNSLKSYVDLMYASDKEISFKVDYTSAATSSLSFTLETPFEMLEKTTYVMSYSGNHMKWDENTRFESYYGTISSSTSFSLTNGLTYHQTITGDMKNRMTPFNLQKDFIFTGMTDKFDVQASISGSFIPETKFETSWQYDPLVTNLKAAFNQHSLEYNHRGDVISDFTCSWKIVSPVVGTILNEDVQQLEGEWTIKNAGYSFSTDISCPNHNFKMDWDLSSLSGTFNSQYTDGTDIFRSVASFKRSATPFKYEGSFSMEAPGEKLTSSIMLTENSLDLPLFTWNNKEYITIRAKNPLNADEEYKPTIVLVVDGETYEFDGLYKNVGSGLVRDFKLHMNGPRGFKDVIDFQFEFRTQSAQLVPGDMKFFLSYVPAQNAEIKLVDLTGTWGNDHATFIFRDPTPMKYNMDFSVSTTGQTATFEANWDTTATDKNAKLEIVNKFASSSRKLSSSIDINLVYTGISRGLTSEMEWTTDAFSHLLTLDYNGKSIGYEVKSDQISGVSIELLSEWRSVKVTLNNKTVTNGNELQVGFYWDSQRDTQKRFIGTSQWVNMGTNSYKWTTTISHPALFKDITITDLISFNTNQHYFDFQKMISYSADTTKDVTFDMNLQKDLQWGVSLKQTFNKIDIRVGTEFTTTGSTTSVKYMDSNGQMKSFALVSKFNPTTMAASMELQTPMKTVKLATVSSKTTLTLSTTIDGETYSTDITLRPSDYYMLIKLSGVNGNMQFAAQKIVGGYEIQLTKTNGTKTTVEGLAALSMNASRLVNGKLHWNPTLVSDIKAQIAAIRSSLKNTIKSMSAAANAEATLKMSKMQLGSDFDQIMPHQTREYDLFMQDLATAKVMVQQGYEQNIFYLKSIDEFTSSLFSTMALRFEEFCTELESFYSDVVVPKMSYLGEQTQQTMLSIATEFSNIKRQMQNFGTNMATKMMESTESMRRRMTRLNSWLQSGIDTISEFVKEHPIAQTLKAYHVSIVTSFNSAADSIYSRVVAVVNPQMYKDAVYKVHRFIVDTIGNSRIAQYIDVTVFTGLFDTAMYKAEYYMQYYDVVDNMKIFMTHAKNIGAEYLDKYLTYYIDETIDNFKWVTYDLQGGEIECEFVVPSTLNSLNNLNAMQMASNAMSAMRSSWAQIYDYDMNVSNIVDKYIPATYKHVLPPFDVQGIIAGQHIRTFDRRHYDFSSGTCSYLLARDFQDGNFTIFVNYNGEEQSLTVHSNGKIIDIAQDLTIKMDGAKVELPVQFFNTSISRLGYKIVLKNALGVSVICDNMNGLCSVEMSGHYFAKTGGLFGTYNYEPLDDFTTSSNTNTSDVTSFANSWTSSCTGSNTARTFSHVENTKEHAACAALFKDTNSSLSPCFGVVSSEHAFHKCINDMSKDVTLTATNGPCKAAMFYQAECKFAGVKLPVPSQCVSCSVSGVTFEQGESQQIRQPVMAADVVIVVEEKMCNYEIDSKLPALAKLIESSLSRKSYSDIRFGLVGFGGQGVHSPSHVHTMNSKMFASRSDLSLGSSALQFSAGSNNDVYDAIDFAAQYPFRAGASKMVVVIPCSDCSESRHSHQGIAERLYSEDITLHVLNEFSYDISIAGKNPATNYLFGIDNYAVYSLRDIRSLRGNTRLYPIVTKPTDACSSLALQTNGVVFDVNMMKTMRSSTIKSFQTVFANVMSNNVSPRRCTSCTCEYNELFMTSRTVCSAC